jgi:hypothetical protein
MFPSLSVCELRLKIEHALSRPPQATDWPLGANAHVITHGQCSFMACVFWLVNAFHTISLPSCEALTIQFFSGVQSREYTCNEIYDFTLVVRQQEHIDIVIRYIIVFSIIVFLRRGSLYIFPFLYMTCIYSGLRSSYQYECYS